MHDIDLMQVHCCVGMMNWQGIELIAQHDALDVVTVTQAIRFSMYLVTLCSFVTPCMCSSPGSYHSSVFLSLCLYQVCFLSRPSSNISLHPVHTDMRITSHSLLITSHSLLKIIIH